MEMSGHLTVMLIGPELLFAKAPDASLVAEAEAVFATVPHVADVVGEKIWTVLLAPGARSPNEQVKLPLEIVQEAASAPSLLQLVPPFVGSVSLTVTPLAVPVPAALELVTVIV
jgi:hypothetical protein